MRGSDKDLFHEILFLGTHADLAPPSPVLALIEADCVAFNVSGMRDGNNHIFFDDHVFNINIFRAGDNFRTPFISVFAFDFVKFIDDDPEDFLRVSQNAFQPGYQCGYLRVFRVDLFSFQSGQALQPHLENRFGLDLGQIEFRAQGNRRFIGIFCRLDDFDDFVDVVQGNDVAFQNMRPFFGARQVKTRAADNHLLPKYNEFFQYFL